MRYADGTVRVLDLACEHKLQQARGPAREAMVDDTDGDGQDQALLDRARAMLRSDLALDSLSFPSGARFRFFPRCNPLRTHFMLTLPGGGTSTTPWNRDFEQITCSISARDLRTGRVFIPYEIRWKGQSASTYLNFIRDFARKLEAAKAPASVYVYDRAASLSTQFVVAYEYEVETPPGTESFTARVPTESIAQEATRIVSQIITDRIYVFLEGNVVPCAPYAGVVPRVTVETDTVRDQLRVLRGMMRAHPPAVWVMLGEDRLMVCTDVPEEVATRDPFPTHLNAGDAAWFREQRLPWRECVLVEGGPGT